MTAIRDALAGDAAEVARVHVLSWKEAYRGVLPDEYLDALQVEDRLAWWIERLTADRDPRDHVLVAEDEDGHVCGFASAGPCQDDEGATAELRQIYLVPPVWGRGIGRALLAEVVERLRRDGYSEASL